MSGKSELKINSRFAEKYDKYRQKEELQRRKWCYLLANCSQSNQANKPTWETRWFWAVGNDVFSFIGFTIRLFCFCVVKDRFGDRADESGSELSESSSDDSEVVSCFSPFHVINKELRQCANVLHRLSRVFYRNWTLQLKGTFTEHCHCWRRKTQRSIRRMQRSTQKVVNRDYWLFTRWLGHLFIEGSDFVAFRGSPPWRQAFNLKDSREAHVPQGLWTSSHTGKRRVSEWPVTASQFFITRLTGEHYLNSFVLETNWHWIKIMSLMNCFCSWKCNLLTTLKIIPSGLMGLF